MLASIKQNEKTIVFCANQAHAAKIRDIINQESANKTVDYCVRVTANDGKIGEMHLRNFQDNDKELPTILTTSQKLSTGVDAKNVRNIVLMRPVNSMIEFKQIIGRGTRLFDGKHYFTVIDFVNAYHLFNDPEWDGEPIEPESIEPRPPKPDDPETPPIVSDGRENPDPDAPPKKVKIKLRDEKEREIQSMSSTYLYIGDHLVGVEDFVKKVFDTLHLPEFFGSEDNLKKLWANPITRRELLERLENEGCSKSELLKLQEMIAKDSDLLDVLEYIAYARRPITRQERVSKAKDNIYTFLNAEQKEFIDFVLNNYIKDGIDGLDDSKLGKLIVLKYKSNTDAERVLGNPAEIRKVFIDFQKHLYLENVG